MLYFLKQILKPFLSVLLIVVSSTYSAADTLPDLIVVKVPTDSLSPPQVSYYVDGCSISRISFSEKGLREIPLAPGFLSARDPSLSFDGHKIFFSGKKDISSFYQIYQMNIDGTEIVQITHAKANHSSPLQVGTLFYLNDTTPVQQLVYGRQSFDSPVVYALFASNIDGTKPRQITHNIYTDIEADVLPNGRLVFSSHSDKTYTGMPIAQLMAVNIDGTDLMPVTGSQRPDHHQRMARMGFDNRIYFIESSTMDEFSGGSIGSVSQLRSLHSYSPVTAANNFIYPCPLPDKRLLASRRSHNGAFQLVTIHNDDTHHVLLAAPGHHIIDAKPVMVRKQVRGRSSVVGFRHQDSGIFFSMNVYESDQQEIKVLKPGSVTEVLVANAQRSKPNKVRPLLASSSEQYPNAPLSINHHILGRAPVEKDGSFHIRIPAKTPVTFHLLDKQGKILASQRSFTWVMPGESRGCIGCHEDRELSPPNVFIDAVKKPPVKLLPKSTAQKPFVLGGVK